MPLASRSRDLEITVRLFLSPEDEWDQGLAGGLAGLELGVERGKRGVGGI